MFWNIKSFVSALCAAGWFTVVVALTVAQNSARASQKQSEYLTLIFDLQGTLIQGVPKELAAEWVKSESASSLIEVEGKFYHLHRGTRMLLEHLAGLPQVKIVFVDYAPKKIIEGVLSKIPLFIEFSGYEKFTNARAIASQIYSYEELKATKPSEPYLLIADEESEKRAKEGDPSLHTFSVGASFYAYPSFELARKIHDLHLEKHAKKIAARVWSPEQAAKEAESEARIEKRYPVTLADWKLEQDKLLLLEARLLPLLSAPRSTDFESKIKSDPSPEELKAVMDRFEVERIPFVFRFDIETIKPENGDAPFTRTHCRGKRGSDPNGIQTTEREFPFEVCLNSLPTDLQWILIEKKPYCLRMSGDGKVRLRFESFSECEKLYGPVSAQFYDPEDPKLGMIPEIVQLSSGATVPKEFYRTHDSRAIAASIVARIHRLREKKSSSTTVSTSLSKDDFQFWKDTEIQIAFWDQYAESIEKNCFLNQHQTFTSKGTLDHKTRAEVEDQFTELKLEEKVGDLGKADPVQWVRPKYAYLVFRSQKTPASYSHQYSEHYGNVFAVLHDSVKFRSTFTPEDSLSMHPNWGRKSENVSSFFRSKDPELKVIIASYAEAQIWGSLCFRDVAYFLVNCPNQNAVPPPTIDFLSKTGIPVYECVLENPTPQAQRYKQAKVIDAGDSKRRKKYELQVPLVP